MHRQMINSTLIYFAMILLQALLQIVLLPLQTHFLSPTDYGVLAIVVALAIVLSPVFNLGLQGAAQRFMVDNPEDPIKTNQLLSTLLFISLVAGVFSAFLTLAILFLIPPDLYAHFIRIEYFGVAIIHAIAMGAVLVGSDCLRMLHQPQRYALSMTIMSLAYLSLNIIFIGLFHWGLAGALSAFALMPWIGYFSIILTSKKYWAKPAAWPFCMEIMRYSIKLMPHFAFSTLNSVADRLLLAIILGQYITGIYTAGTTIASVMLMITSAFGYSARPQIFSRFSLNTRKSLAEVSDLAVSSMLIIGLAGANLCLWSPEVLHLLTASSYHQAWQVTIILCLKYMLQGLSIFILSSLIFAKEKTHHLLWVAIISLSILITCSVYLAPQYGILGVALAGLVATLCELMFNYFLSKSAFQMSWPFSKMLALILLFFTPACAILFYTQSTVSIASLLMIKISFSFCSTFIVLSLLSRQYGLSISGILTALIPRRAIEP